MVSTVSVPSATSRWPWTLADSAFSCMRGDIRCRSLVASSHYSWESLIALVLVKFGERALVV